MRDDTLRLERVALVAYGVWAGVLGVWGRPGPYFPTGARAITGIAMMLICFTVAVRPTPRRVELVLFATAGFALWSAARVIAADFDSATAIAGATTYLLTAVTALVLAGLIAILAGIDAVVEVHGSNE